MAIPPRKTAQKIAFGLRPVDAVLASSSRGGSAAEGIANFSVGVVGDLRFHSGACGLFTRRVPQKTKEHKSEQQRWPAGRMAPRKVMSLPLPCVLVVGLQ